MRHGTLWRLAYRHHTWLPWINSGSSSSSSSSNNNNTQLRRQRQQWTIA
jgi:hypothetical protein